MTTRIRTYTFKVSCPLPNTRQGETRALTSFVYGATTMEDARAKWFANNLSTARKHGVRGQTENLQKRLPLTIERVNLSTIIKPR
jgi:hypothetical protein